ncbi:MAG: hypothetical protein WC817_03925 [Patescibacteria group bacterium]|jgi:hypothetical protein
MHEIGRNPKKFIFLFLFALILNWVWETTHSVLYVHYQGGAITPFVLLRAALVDAIVILALALLAQKFKLNKSTVVVTGGLIIAIVIELWALETGRWAYTAFMPIVPILNVGLTPILQLALTGYISEKLLTVS